MCRRFLVEGHVQGVGYRNFARRAALALGLRGQALNLPDGRVEVLACGEAAALERFAAQLREGPRWARVEGLEAAPAECADDGAGFGTG